jgi:hypothetical protein
MDATFHLLTPFHIEKFIFFQLVKKFSAIYETRRFITSSQERATGRCPAPNDLIPHPRFLVFEVII